MMTALLLLVASLTTARADTVQDPYKYVCGSIQAKSADDLRARSQEIETVYAAAAKAFSANHNLNPPLGPRELIERIEQEVRKAKQQGLMPSPEAIRSNWPKIPALDQALDLYLDYLVMVEDAAIRWVNLKRSLSGTQAMDADRVASLVATARDSLKIAIQEEPGWTKEQRKAALDEIDPIQALTPSRIKSMSDPVDRHYLTLVYFLRCGPSGEYVNMFSKTPESGLKNGRIAHGKPIMAVCPGMIMSLADQSNVVETLKNLMAHEMAHQFDVSVKDESAGFLRYDGEVVHRDFSKAYRNFHKCLYSNGYNDLGDARKVISEYRAKSADTYVSEDERARYAFQAELLENKMSRVVSRVGREPTKLETHQEEIDADYWSFSELGDSVSELADEPARARVKQTLSYLCSTTDDGFRPSGRFRIGMAFQNRVIAAKTGYRPAASSSSPGAEGRAASCQMSGEVEVAQAPKAGKPKAAEPETGVPIPGRQGGHGRKGKDNGRGD
jgi:hypothetical protein